MIHLTEENFADVMEENELLIIDFWAEWCVPCKKFLPVLEAFDAEVFDEGEVAVGKVNVDEEPDITAAFEIDTIPAIVFVKNGEEVQRLVGMQTKEQLLKTAEQLR